MPFPVSNRSLLLLLASMLGLLTLTGCATLSREQCVRGDWYQIGLHDGQSGHALSRLNDHRSACRDTPAIVNEQAYRAGRDVGLVSYCTPVSGYRVGTSGNRAAAVCPAHLASGYLQGHMLGHQAFDAEQALANAQQNVRTIERDLRATRDHIDTARQRLETAQNQADRRPARRALRALREQRRDARDRLHHAQVRVDHARRHFQSVQERTSFQLQQISPG